MKHKPPSASVMSSHQYHKTWIWRKSCSICLLTLCVSICEVAIFFYIMLKCASANIDLEACQSRYAFNYSWASLIATFYHDSLSIIFHDGHTVSVTLEGYLCGAFGVDSPKLLIFSVNKAQARANAKAISLIDVLSTLP